MTHISDPAAHQPGETQTDGASSQGLDGDRKIRFAQSIDIDRSIEEVFAYLADFTNIPRWNYYVERVRQIIPGPVTVGTTYDQTRRTDRQRFAVTVYHAPTILAVTTLPGERPAFHRHFELRSVGDGTRLNDRWELDLGYLLILQRLATPQVKKAIGENLAVLKRLLEHDARP